MWLKNILSKQDKKDDEEERFLCKKSLFAWNHCEFIQRVYWMHIGQTYWWLWIFWICLKTSIFTPAGLLFFLPTIFIILLALWLQEYILRNSIVTSIKKYYKQSKNRLIVQFVFKFTGVLEFCFFLITNIVKDKEVFRRGCTCLSVH